jgi:hypothetical protein
MQRIEQALERQCELDGLSTHIEERCVFDSFCRPQG